MSETVLSSPHAAETGRHADANVPAIIIALALGAFAIGCAEFSAMSLLPAIAAGLGVAEPTAAHVVSAYAVGVVVGAPLLAIGFARVSRRAILILALAVFGLSNVLSALVNSYEGLLALRFVAGLPHGAFLGVAALAAAALVDHKDRAKAVSYVLLGLTSAMIVGVPLATFIGQSFSWHWGFVLPGVLALVSMALLIVLLPLDAASKTASPLGELRALGNRAVWLTLLTAAVGFAGFFAVYSYTASTLREVTMVPADAVPWIFSLFGIGMTLGTVVAGRAADRNLMATPVVMMSCNIMALIAFSLAAFNIWVLLPVMVLVGFTSSLSGVLQTRLMDVAQGVQTTAAALNHSAFNVANALGPLAAGFAITHGFGYASSGVTGALFAAAGLLIWLFTWWDSTRPGRGV